MFPMQVGAPLPTQSLFGNTGGGGGDVLEWLSGLMGGGQAPQPMMTPTAAPSPTDAIKSEMERQIGADPTAQANAGDQSYTDMLKAELLKQLRDDTDPRRAISKALAAAGAAMSGGQDIWGGITTGVSAYHDARDNRSGRIDTLKTMVDLEEAEADRPMKAEERRLDMEGKRALIDQRKASAARQRGQAAAKKEVDTLDPLRKKLKDRREVEELKAKRYEALGLDDEYSRLSEEKLKANQIEYEAFAKQIDEEYAPLLGGVPQMGAPEEPQIHVHPQTKQRIRWNGSAWVDATTGAPVQ